MKIFQQIAECLRVNIVAGVLVCLVLMPGCSLTENRRQLVFLGTADLQGHLDETIQKSTGDLSDESVVAGGISRLSVLIDQEKRKNENGVCVISSGDDLMGRYFHTYKGKAIYTLMSIAGYDLYAPGNHEFDKGLDVWLDSLRYLDMPVLCSDLSLSGGGEQEKCRSTLVKEINGVKVGFFSLMTEALQLLAVGGNGLLVGNNIDVGREKVAELKDQGVELVVAVTHIGFEQDKILAASVEGIDVIFGGHSHEYLDEVVQVGRTLIVNGGEKGTNLVRLAFEVGEQGCILSDSIKYELIPVAGSLQIDNETEEKLADFRSRLPATVVLGRNEKVWDLSKRTLRNGESDFANMVNDLLLARFEADIVLNNSGAFRGNSKYGPGAITNSMLRSIDEFENTIFVLRLQGRYIKQVLERSAAMHGKGGFLQLAGVRYVVDLSGEKQTLAVAGEAGVIKAGSRIVQVQVKDRDGGYSSLQMDKEYGVVTNGFMARKSGDGYFWFEKYGIDVCDTYTSLYSIMADTVAREKILNPEPLDGRVVVIVK